MDMTVMPHPLLGDRRQRALIAAVQDGLPLLPRPFAEIGRQVGLSEREVIRGLQVLLEQGVIKRLGVVVRHHELGYRANAMVVWDIPDERVAEIGRRFGAESFVTLCYRRPRRPPQWPFNLFTMIHGSDRHQVLQHVRTLRLACAIDGVSHQVLFSRRRFKQRGARYDVAGLRAPADPLQESSR
jgi:DNA-binding Lrp family transcriptional regulator